MNRILVFISATAFAMAAHGEPVKRAISSKTLSSNAVSSTQSGKIIKLISEAKDGEAVIQYAFRADGQQRSQRIEPPAGVNLNTGDVVEIDFDKKSPQRVASVSVKTAARVMPTSVNQNNATSNDQRRVLVLPLHKYNSSNGPTASSPIWEDEDNINQALNGLFKEMSYEQMDLQVDVAKQWIDSKRYPIQTWSGACSIALNALNEDIRVRQYLNNQTDFDLNDYDYILFLYAEPQSITYDPTGCAILGPNKPEWQIYNDTYNFGVAVVSIQDQRINVEPLEDAYAFTPPTTFTPVPGKNPAPPVLANLPPVVTPTSAGKVWFKVGFNSLMGAAIAHELGHSMGLEHARQYECGADDWPGDCYLPDYTELNSIMGGSAGFHNGGRHISPADKLKLGWLDSHYTIIGAPGTYRLGAYETGNPYNDPKVGVIQIPGKGHYFFAYRSSNGYSALATEQTGLAIWRAIPIGGPYTYTGVIDLTPVAYQGLDSAATNLTDTGEFFEDTDFGIKLKLVSKNSHSISVEIELTSPNLACERRKPMFLPNNSAHIHTSHSSGGAFQVNLAIYNADSPACGLTNMAFGISDTEAGMENLTFVANPSYTPIESGSSGTITLTGTVDPSVPAGSYGIDMYYSTTPSNIWYLFPNLSLSN